jgi:hypothetical protein
MRGRDTPEIQAIGQLCGNLAVVGGGLYVVWSTAIAFAGGTIPLTDIAVHGGVGFGILWALVADPLLASLAVLCTYVLVALATVVLPVTDVVDGPTDPGRVQHLS